MKYIAFHMRIPFYGFRDSHKQGPILPGEMTNIPPVSDFKEELIRSLDAPIASQSLASLAKGKKNILFLVEDNTRDNPLAEILPVVTGYLKPPQHPRKRRKFHDRPRDAPTDD